MVDCGFDYCMLWYMNSTLKLKTISTKKPHVWEYPCLGITDNNAVILFIAPRTGTIVRSPPKSVWKLGETSRGWPMSQVRPLPQDQEIVLSN